MYQIPTVCSVFGCGKPVALRRLPGDLDETLACSDGHRWFELPHVPDLSMNDGCRTAVVLLFINITLGGLVTVGVLVDWLL